MAQKHYLMGGFFHRSNVSERNVVILAINNVIQDIQKIKVTVLKF